MTPVFTTALLRTQSDSRLLELAGAGNERAFEAIVERYRKPLHRYCRRALGDAQAEDCVQHTFMKAWSAIGDGAQIRDLRAWLYRVAQNSALDTVRRSGYDYSELSDSLGVAGDTEEAVEKRAVMRRTLVGVAGLPERQREALLQTAVEGRSREEVAAQMGLSEGAVRQLVHRARASLRSAATAITPLPLVNFLASASPESTPLAQRVSELAAGAGTAGIGGALVKGGVVVVAAGAIATAPGGPDLGVGNTSKKDAKTSQSSAASSALESSSAAAGAGPARGRHGEAATGTHRRGRHGRSGQGTSGDDSSGHGRGGGSDDATSSERHGGGSGGDSASGEHSGSGRSGRDNSGRSGDSSGSSGSGTSGSGRSGSSGHGSEGDDSSDGDGPLLSVPTTKLDSSGPGSSGLGSPDSSGSSDLGSGKHSDD